MDKKEQQCTKASNSKPIEYFNTLQDLNVVKIGHKNDGLQQQFTVKI